MSLARCPPLRRVWAPASVHRLDPPSSRRSGGPRVDRPKTTPAAWRKSSSTGHHPAGRPGNARAIASEKTPASPSPITNSHHQRPVAAGAIASAQASKSTAIRQSLLAHIPKMSDIASIRLILITTAAHRLSYLCSYRRQTPASGTKTFQNAQTKHKKRQNTTSRPPPLLARLFRDSRLPGVPPPLGGNHRRPTALLTKPLYGSHPTVPSQARSCACRPLAKLRILSLPPDLHMMMQNPDCGKFQQYQLIIRSCSRSK